MALVIPLSRRSLLLAASAALVPGAALVSAAARAPDHETWKFDNLRRIGGHGVRVEGTPKVIGSPFGKAVAFDGRQDALFIDAHPLAGAKAFTFEAIFRPDGGAFEQRWFHLESDENPPVAPGTGRTRMLFEIRVVDAAWYLDAFATGPGYRQTLMMADKRFDIGRWYHVAQSFDGRFYRAFVDGALQAEAEIAFAAQGPGRASVGTRMNRTSFFNGAILKARFTHAALDPAEFSRLPAPRR